MITSHLDIFPTVVDLVFGVEMPRCGLGPGSSHETKLCTEGTSLVPLIRNPERPVKVAAYSVYTRDVPGASDAESDELRTEALTELSYADVATSFSGGRHGGGGGGGSGGGQHGGGGRHGGGGQHALQHGGGQHGGSGPGGGYQHGGSIHGGGGSQHRGYQHGGSQHSRSGSQHSGRGYQHGGSQHGGGGSQHGGGGSQHGGGGSQHGGGGSQHGGGGSQHGGSGNPYQQGEDATSWTTGASPPKSSPVDTPRMIPLPPGEGEHDGPPSSCLDHGGSGMGCVMGFSMQTLHSGHEFRLTEWVHFSGPRSNWKPDWHASYGTELYNHSCDAEENINRYPVIERAAPGLAAELRDRLHKGWHRNFEP
jgi:hypothetical protein